jgi:hypothetical protein
LVELADYEFFSGSIFKFSERAGVTTLCNLTSSCAAGASPSGLIAATDGNFYGTTLEGSLNPPPVYGTVFEITPGGVMTRVYGFCAQPGCADGSNPVAGLLQATNGDFYGTTTNFTDASNEGTVFRLSAGLRPFVETLPVSGRAGARIRILGTDLTGATSVTLNGTAASFDVIAPTQIAATVPSGASTGEVKVVTPNGTLSSNVPFRVLP